MLEAVAETLQSKLEGAKTRTASHSTEYLQIVCSQSSLKRCARWNGRYEMQMRGTMAHSCIALGSVLPAPGPIS